MIRPDDVENVAVIGVSGQRRLVCVRAANTILHKRCSPRDHRIPRSPVQVVTMDRGPWLQVGDFKLTSALEIQATTI